MPPSSIFDQPLAAMLAARRPTASFGVPRAINRGPVIAAGAAMVAGALILVSAEGWRQSALFLVGSAAGIVLYHAAFGFTSAWRQLIVDGRGAGLRAQMLMLGAACLVFMPLLAKGELFGRELRGSVAPLSMSVAVGAFVFGVGMQLGGGCASGTLYSAGGGSVRMLVTLAAFIAGSVLGVLQTPLWDQAPALPAVSLVSQFGMWTALSSTVAVLGGLTMVARAVERRRHRAVEPTFSRREGRASLLHGPWPLAAGALGLAAINISTLILAGRPWGVTSAFALWGSKFLMAIGVQVADWPYWQPAARAAELRATVLRDVTSMMDLGIMLGALAAAGLAGRFAPVWRVPARSLVAAVLGGLMLGYGARIAYGCNIGAYFSGIASSSLHGWLWFAAAFAGNVAGTRLRPFFNLH